VTEPHIQLLDDLGVEFARVAANHERSPRRSRRWVFGAAPRRVLVIASCALALVVCGTYAVPPTRAAIESIADSFAGWVAGDDDQPPGRALSGGNAAPDWVREQGGRLIAETDGVGLYVTRVKTEERGTLLTFALGNSVSVGGNIDDWRERFDRHALIVLGAGQLAPQVSIDERGRFPLFGVTARSVTSVKLVYEEGSSLTADDVDGGFVLMADARRPLRELIAYDAAGQELERRDVSHIDMRDLCKQTPGCAAP
jgi:hypothetical protein